MKQTLYFVIEESIGAEYNVIGSEILYVCDTKARAIEFAQAHIERLTTFETWQTPKAKQINQTEWELIYNRRHASTIRVKQTSTLSADEIYKKFNVKPSQKDKEALHQKLIGVQKTQQSTTIINNQNQSTMANSKSFKKVPYTGAKDPKAGNRVVGNPYQFTSNGKMYQAVPERMVTLPHGNHFIVAKKHVMLGGQYNNQATYVLGYSNLDSKRNSGKTRRMYFVARLIWRGGNPALALYRYTGYDYQLAKDVFSEIAYDSAEYLGKDGNFHPYRVKSMNAKDIVAAKLKKQEALERLKTAAYGSKAERVAYAKSHKGYYRVK